MKNQIIASNASQTTHWAGGKTTEIFIWPPDSAYTERNFDVRVSSATVELEHSDFTNLPGYQRLLMPLDGSMQLQYELHGGVTLQPGEVVAFDGGWNTVSDGKCVDFGLMLAQGWSGTLCSVQQHTEITCMPFHFTGIYANQNGVHLEIRSSGEHQTVVLNKGDCLLMQDCDADTSIAITTCLPDEIGAVVFTAYPDTND